MKKGEKTAKKGPSARKLFKKEVEEKLLGAVTEVLAPYGKIKKAKALIEKLAKRLAKRIEPVKLAEPVAQPVSETLPEEVKKTRKAPTPKKTAIEKA